MQELEKTIKKYHTRARLSGIFSFAAALLAVLLALGALICAIVAFFSEREVLCYLIACIFLAVTALTAPAAYLLSVLSRRAEALEEDCLERTDGEESFFVGEGTLASFSDGALILHEREGERRISIPYKEIRFLSVCERKAPREKGEWSVAIEVPARYLEKKKTDGAPPLLIRARGKERLYRAIAAHGFSLLGEAPSKGNEKFSLTRRFSIPNRKKRTTGIVVTALGGAAAAAGVPIAVLLDLSFGVVLSCLGVFVLCRGIFLLFRASARFEVYREGIYWRESSRAESFFFKWEEIVRIAPEEREGSPLLLIECFHGEYRIPRAKGAEEFLKETVPALFGGE